MNWYQANLHGFSFKTMEPFVGSKMSILTRRYLEVTGIPCVATYSGLKSITTPVLFRALKFDNASQLNEFNVFTFSVEVI